MRRRVVPASFRNDGTRQTHRQARPVRVARARRQLRLFHDSYRRRHYGRVGWSGAFLGRYDGASRLRRVVATAQRDARDRKHNVADIDGGRSVRCRGCLRRVEYLPRSSREQSVARLSYCGRTVGAWGLARQRWCERTGRRGLFRGLDVGIFSRRDRVSVLRLSASRRGRRRRIVVGRFGLFLGRELLARVGGLESRDGVRAEQALYRRNGRVAR